MENSSRFDKIEAYLKGLMSAEDQKAFDLAIRNDDALAEEVALQKIEHELMERMLAKNLQAQMKEWRNENSSPPESKNKKGNYLRNGLLLLAFAALVFKGYSSFVEKKRPEQKKIEDIDRQSLPGDQNITPSTPNTTEKKNLPIAKEETIKSVEPTKQANKTTNKDNTDLELLALNHYDNQRPPPFTIRLKSEKTAIDSSAYTKAAAAFDQKQYAESLQLLGDSSVDEQSNIHYLRGHLFFNLKKYEQAASEFEYVAQTENSFLPFYQDAQWYLFLALLAQQPEMREQLDALANDLLNTKNFAYKATLEQLYESIKASE